MRRIQCDEIEKDYQFKKGLNKWISTGSKETNDPKKNFIEKTFNE